MFNISLKLDFWNEKTFVSWDTICEWFYAFSNLSYFDEFPFFLARQKNLSLSKYLEAYPRQMQLGMRCFKALKIEAGAGSCNTSSNDTFVINSCQFQTNLFHV